MDKLYPPKCDDCEAEITLEDFKNDNVETHTARMRNGCMQIWMTHKYNCKERLKKYENSKR